MLNKERFLEDAIFSAVISYPSVTNIFKIGPEGKYNDSANKMFIKAMLSFVKGFMSEVSPVFHGEDSLKVKKRFIFLHYMGVLIGENNAIIKIIPKERDSSGNTAVLIELKDYCGNAVIGSRTLFKKIDGTMTTVFTISTLSYDNMKKCISATNTIIPLEMDDTFKVSEMPGTFDCVYYDPKSVEDSGYVENSLAEDSNAFNRLLEYMTSRYVEPDDRIQHVIDVEPTQNECTIDLHSEDFSFLEDCFYTYGIQASEYMYRSKNRRLK